MKTKDEFILEIREQSIGKISENSSIEEKFQNQTLRPILKLQNNLLLEIFRNYATKQKGTLFLLSIEKKMHYVENAIQKDIKFRNTLKGIIIGMFTIYEYKEYIQNASNLNKRMMTMLIERIQSQIQLFEN
uniref:glyoxalase n=1 Tax=Flavobacterium sp. TaxID=239 RepID=UPI00404B8935